mmetsp:Transcript_24780/g.32373  ORF Transcript_24780/g.32373 Transcript_24780/m.32373 type:complete len:662 (+) Transcript_24780:190-2175(+)
MASASLTRCPYLFTGSKINLYVIVLLTVGVAILLLRLGYYPFLRPIYWGIQACGGIYIAVLPWKYAYPSVLSDKKFSFIVFTISLVSILLFTTAGELFENSSYGYKVMKTAFEIVFMGSIFVVFPLLYSKKCQKKGIMLHLGAIPTVVYGTVASIATYWGNRFFMYFSWIMILPWAGAVIYDRKYGTISRDYGYIMMLGILSLALPVVMGYSMLNIIADAASLMEKIRILTLWSILCVTVRCLWFPVASGALNDKAAATYIFPMQLSVDCYDELIFGLSTWRTTDFAVMLMYRIIVNFLRNSGIFSDFIAWIANLPWLQGNSKQKQSEDDFSLKQLKEFQTLEQNIATESLASIVVLCSAVFDEFFNLFDLGQKTVNNGLKKHEVNDVIISYSIVTVCLALTSVVSGKILAFKYKSLQCTVSPEVDRNPSSNSLIRQTKRSLEDVNHSSYSNHFDSFSYDEDENSPNNRKTDSNTRNHASMTDNADTKTAPSTKLAKNVVGKKEQQKIERQCFIQVEPLAFTEDSDHQGNVLSSENGKFSNNSEIYPVSKERIAAQSTNATTYIRTSSTSEKRATELMGRSNSKSLLNEEQESGRGSFQHQELFMHPSRVDQLWGKFFCFYYLCSLYTIFDVLWRIIRIYRKIRGEDVWEMKGPRGEVPGT